MITGSAAWNNLYKKVEDELLPESDIRIINTDDVLAPVTASNVATSAWMQGYTDRTNVATCGSSATMNEPTKKLATAEWNSFILDGSFTLWEDSSDNVREFASEEICDENCNFANPPYIEIKEVQAANKTWRTVKFAPNRNEHGVSITLKTNSDNSVSHPPNVSPTIRNINVNEYDTDYVLLWAGSEVLGDTSIYINSWSKPYRRARIQEFRIGKRFLWNRDNIMETVRYNKSVDMVNAELPQNDIEFQFYDPNNDFDKWNTSAAFANAFNSNSKFLINCGYLINGAWEWKKTDTLYFRELSRPSNSLSATLKLENSMQKMQKRIPKFDLTAEMSDIMDDSNNPPNAWKNYGEFVSILNKINDVTITMDNSVVNLSKSDTNHKKLCYPYTGIIIQRAAPNQSISNSITKRFWGNYFKTKSNELLQMISQVLTSLIKINRDGNIVLISKTNNNGKLKNKNNFTIVDTIKLNEMYEYPEIEQLENISKIEFSTLDYTYEGNVSFYEKNAIKEQNFNYSSIGTEQTLTNNLLYYKKNNPVNEPDSYYFRTDTGIHPAQYASDYVYDMISGAIKITVNTIINPLWEMGDFIAIETKNGTDIKTYQGFLINMDMEYAGTFKGKITVLVPKSYQ